jgi:hypothetical protein
MFPESLPRIADNRNAAPQNRYDARIETSHPSHPWLSNQAFQYEIAEYPRQLNSS